MTTEQLDTVIRSMGKCKTCGTVLLFVGSTRHRNGRYCTCLTTGVSAVADWWTGPAGKKNTDILWRKISGRVTSKACSDECVSAIGTKCACSCGGENHGSAHGMPF